MSPFKTIKHFIKTVLFAIAKRNVFFRKILRKALFAKRRASFRKRSVATTNPKMIVFQSFMGRTYGDNPKAIYEAMLKDPAFQDFIFVWAFKKPLEYEYLKANNGTTIIRYGSRWYYELLSEAKYWVSNSRLPDHVLKKEDQIYIQTWHGTPLKKLGFDILDDKESAMNTAEELKQKHSYENKLYNYLLSPSRYATNCFATAFGLREENKEHLIYESGYPRNDFLFQFSQEDFVNIKKNLGLPDDKKVILYAPTFRDNQHKAGTGYTYSLGVDFDNLKKHLSDDFVILFRAHYFVANEFDFEKYSGFVYDVSSYDDINHLYIASDLLMTDYSSVFFDYANLKRPMLFYMYDLDEYKNNLRDFYMSLDELPGPIIEKEADLIDALIHFEENASSYKEKYNQFSEKFNYLDGPNCSEKVIAHCILGNK